ncbi:MAG: putative hydro-lyase [Hyphomicrobiaceae bacterium]
MNIHVATPDRRSNAQTARLQARQRELTGQTSGYAPGMVQGNLAILPKQFASDFLRFCHFNPKPCPLIGMSEAGDPSLPMLGADIDIRTDVPRYRVFEHGECVDDACYDITDLWRDDLVAFVLGCSFSFEEAILEAGLPLRHIERGVNVAMYRTGIMTTPSGPFSGPLVVSMRPFKPADAIRAVQITTRFPQVHGAPIHFGDPQAIGIADINQPDWGPPPEIQDGEVPVFWACGVTPQAIIEQAKPPFSITHYPGSMLITDLFNAELAAL